MEQDKKHVSESEKTVVVHRQSTVANYYCIASFIVGVVFISTSFYFSYITIEKQTDPAKWKWFLMICALMMINGTIMIVFPLIKMFLSEVINVNIV